MKIILINAPVGIMSDHARMTLPLGLAYIGAALLDAGHHVTAMDLNVSGLDLDRVSRAVKRQQPSVVGISALTETYPNALAIARQVKQADPSVTVVMGGAHPTIMPEEVLGDDAVDYVVVGSGEVSMVELVGYLEAGDGRLETVPGLGYKDADGATHLNPRSELPHPDTLPLPARELFPIELYRGHFNVLTATGSCPYRCPFCSAAAIWAGRRRTRSPEGIAAEIEILMRDYGADYVFFTDDVLTVNRRWVLELLEALKGLSRPIGWGCATRVDLVDAELLTAMSEAGCKAIQFGVESGAQGILDSVKGVNKEQVLAAVNASVAAGIDTLCSFMAPFPQDTAETIRETGDFMRTVHDAGSRISLSYTAPFPGTQFYEHAEDLGLRILADSWQDYDAKHVTFETEHLTAAEIEAEISAIAENLGMAR